MSVVKTAVSLQENLFLQIEELADELNLSRSGLVTLALEEYLERQMSKRLIEQLDAVYEDDPQTEELRVSQAHRGKQKRMSEVEW